MPDDKLIIRKYKAEDAMALMADPNDANLKGQAEYARWAKLNETEGPGRTGVYKGEIIGCGGIRIYWKGCGEAWAYFPNNIRHYHIDPKIAKSELYKMIKDYGLKRVQATPRVDWPEGLRYVRYMGFKVEGKMRKYLPGSNGDLADCYMTAIIQE